MRCSWGYLIELYRGTLVFPAIRTQPADLPTTSPGGYPVRHPPSLVPRHPPNPQKSPFHAFSSVPRTLDQGGTGQSLQSGFIHRGILFRDRVLPLPSDLGLALVLSNGQRRPLMTAFAKHHDRNSMPAETGIICVGRFQGHGGGTGSFPLRIRAAHLGPDQKLGIFRPGQGHHP